MPQLAPHIPQVPGSGIRRIYLIASELDDVISLGVGEPDVPVAAHIGEAAKRAWDADQTDYTDNGGIAPLRAALVEKLARENRLHVTPQQVWVTIGATQALHQAMHLLLSAGDEVLIPDPGYTTFTMTPRMLDAVPVPYPLHPDHGFLPEIAQLEQLVSERTKVLVINSPSNPLGTVLSEERMRELLAFARRHDLWILSDEVYEYFAWDEPHVSIASLDDDDRVFTAFSLSKTYAMTGIRIGYLVTPPGMAEVMRTVQETTISCASTPGQYAAIAAVTGSQAPVAEAREHYRSNLTAAMALLDDRGIRYLVPHGTFYLWVDVSHASGGDVAEWAVRFLMEQRVAIAPGSAFGRSGEGWIRVCAAATREDLLEGLRRLPAPGHPAAPPRGTI
ncbi:pyridoxal phosphate-dependent aminotransferase [Galbitalea soli]|uniref:Aminotransferase n=1 Tax=Galbitalea soli TaxID=1268042 RepID=A0A7C9TMK3_9MICO|nr:aminotransferase class I/II-fold pyridoxal phosphate-dependent enzyme [Galbitalea soli]NEM89836.1 aminotransferase class I/II-fold pyridoxal phosphate-dependent enzyme [Galbitalea soli]NYJ30540.1 aspartate aminotransferase [Galbitalea soli]